MKEEETGKVCSEAAREKEKLECVIHCDTMDTQLKGTEMMRRCCVGIVLRRDMQEGKG